MKSAFKRFLGRGKVAYVRNAWVSMEEAVATIISSEDKQCLPIH